MSAREIGKKRDCGIGARSCRMAKSNGQVEWSSRMAKVLLQYHLHHRSKVAQSKVPALHSKVPRYLSYTVKCQGPCAVLHRTVQ